MKTKKMTYTLFGIYLFALAWLILLKGQLSLPNFGFYRNINLIPFQSSSIVNGKIDLDEIIGNVFIFFPYGIFMGALYPETSFPKKLLPIFLTSLAFEVLQYILGIGATDITDLITNTTGGLIGLFLYLLLEKMFKERTLAMINIITLVCGLALLSLFSVIIFYNY